MVITKTFSSGEEILRLRELALSVPEAVLIRSQDGEISFEREVSHGHLRAGFFPAGRDRDRLSVASGADGPLVKGRGTQKQQDCPAPQKRCGTFYIILPAVKLHGI